MKYSALLVLLCSALVPRIQCAPQGGIDFLLGDEELQADVKPIAVNSPSTTVAQVQTVGYDDERQVEVQATVDPIENEQQTEEPQQDLSTTEDYPEEEQLTEDPQSDPLDPATDSPKQNEQNTTTSNDLTSLAPSTTTPSPTKEVSTPVPKTSTAPTLDSVENNSSEEQLTTNPIVVPESGDHSTTESSEDSNQLAQDVNDFIHDLASEGRSSARDELARPQPPKPTSPQYSTILPAILPERYDPKSVESNEDDDQVPLKVDPNDTQTTNVPSFTVEQYHSLREMMNMFGRGRFQGFDPWHHGFPQRSSWHHRDDRQQQNQRLALDSFQGYGFHQKSWH